MKRVILLLALLLVFPTAYAEPDKDKDNLKARVAELETQVTDLLGQIEAAESSIEANEAARYTNADAIAGSGPCFSGDHDNPTNVTIHQYHAHAHSLPVAVNDQAERRKP